MRICSFAVVMLTVGMIGTASAQMSPSPNSQCSPQTTAIAKLQLEASKRLRELAKTESSGVCDQAATAAMLGLGTIMNPDLFAQSLTPEMKELLGKLGFDPNKVDLLGFLEKFGVDVSQFEPSAVKKRCEAEKGNLDQFFAREVDRLEKELANCGKERRDI